MILLFLVSLASSFNGCTPSRGRSCGAARIGRRRLEHNEVGVSDGGVEYVRGVSITICCSSLYTPYTFPEVHTPCLSTESRTIFRSRSLESRALLVVHAPGVLLVYLCIALFFLSSFVHEAMLLIAVKNIVRRQLTIL